jgi:hypothetical protein
MVEFAANRAASHGWSDWYGAKNVGISRWQGIGGNAHTTDIVSKSAGDAAKGLDKVTSSAGKASSEIGDIGRASQGATRGLQEAGKGLGDFGDKLSSATMGGGGGGGGGFFNMLTGLFSGGGGIGGLGSITGLGGIDDFGFGGMWHILHTGGIAGVSGGAHRREAMGLAGLPRYHSGTPGAGLAPDEVPAILRRGEPVFRSMDHARDVVGGSKVLVNVINNAGAQVQTQERHNADGSVGLDVIVDRLVAEKMQQRGTASNNALRRGFGNKQTLKTR